jgi:hypothetical protein
MSLSLHARHLGASLLTGRNILVLLAVLAIVAALLIGPVLGERLFSAATDAGARAAPATFWTGLGLLLAGLVAGFVPLDVIGACLMGSVVAGWIMVNYLAGRRRREGLCSSSRWTCGGATLTRWGTSTTRCS